jgi:hypothetical protein
MSHVSKAAYPVLKQVLCSNAHIKYGPTTSDPTTAFFSPLPTSAPPWDEQRSTDRGQDRRRPTRPAPTRVPPSPRGHAGRLLPCQRCLCLRGHAGRLLPCRRRLLLCLHGAADRLLRAHHALRWQIRGGGRSGSCLLARSWLSGRADQRRRARASSPVLALRSGRSEKKGGRPVLAH